MPISARTSFSGPTTAASAAPEFIPNTARATTEVALMEDDLRKLPAFVCLSREAGNVLLQDISLAIGIKVIFFMLAFAGRATLWMAVFADRGGSLLVVFNGLRLLRGRSSLDTIFAHCFNDKHSSDGLLMIRPLVSPCTCRLS